MFPLWFFILSLLLICYLLYRTRITEEDILLFNDHQADASGWNTLKKE